MSDDVISDFGLSKALFLSGQTIKDNRNRNEEKTA